MDHDDIFSVPDVNNFLDLFVSPVKSRQDALQVNIEELKTSIADIACSTMQNYSPISDSKYDAPLRRHWSLSDPDMQEISDMYSRITYEEVQNTINYLLDNAEDKNRKEVAVDEDVIVPSPPKSPAESQFEDILRCNSNLFAQLSSVTAQVKCLQDMWSELEAELSRLNKYLLSVSEHCNNIEQYGRLYNLVLDNVYNVPVHLKGMRFSLYIVYLLNRLFWPHLTRPVLPADIDKAHPLYRKQNGKSVLIVRFVNRDIRDELFYSRNVLLKNNTGITLRENLTKRNRELFSYAVKKFNYNNVSTDQGKIYVNIGTKLKKRISSVSDLDNLTPIYKLSAKVSKPDVVNSVDPETTNHVFDLSSLLDVISSFKSDSRSNAKLNNSNVCEGYELSKSIT